MKSHARVVVIGGGAVGVSTLYHLAKKGWSDVALVERKELTSGSTWHAAGLLPLFNMSYSVGQLHKYAVDFYPKLEAETGQDVGFSRVGNIRLAMNPEPSKSKACSPALYRPTYRRSSAEPSSSRSRSSLTSKL